MYIHYRKNERENQLMKAKKILNKEQILSAEKTKNTSRKVR